MRVEADAERGRKENEQRHEPLADVRPYACRVVDDVRQKTLHALNAQPRENFGKTLRGTLPVDARNIPLQSVEQVLH